jgi:hypothetical protein
MPGVVYKKLRSRHWTSIEVGLKPDLDNPAVKAFLSIVRQQFFEEVAPLKMRLVPLERARLPAAPQGPQA